MIQERLNKPPLTNKYLSSKVETVRDFQKRRVKWAIETSDGTELSW